MPASAFLPVNRSRQTLLWSLLALVLLGIVIWTSLQPQSIHWAEGQATGSFFVDRSAVLFPATCVQARWEVNGVNAVKLNDRLVARTDSELLCILPNHAPTWATEVVGGFDRLHHLQVGVLLFRFDFWIFLLAIGLCVIQAAASLARFRKPLAPVVRRVASFRDHLFKPGRRLHSWLQLIGSAIEIQFLLRFASFFGDRPWAALAALALTLLILIFFNTRLAHRIIRPALRSVFFPFVLVIGNELVRVLLQQFGTPDSDPLLAEIYIWQGFAFLFLFWVWGVVCFSVLLRGVSFRRRQTNTPMTERDRLYSRVRLVGVGALCLSLIGFWAYVHFFNPAPIYAQNWSWDSEPAFFIDGLNLFIGKPYGYIQHPDASVSIISSAALAFTYPYVNAHADSFVLYQLENPALFVAVVRGLTTLLCCLAMLALTCIVVPVPRSWRDVLLALALPAGMYALHPLSFETITLWSHHTLGFAISVLVLVCLLNVMRSKPRLRHLLAFALAAGLMTAGSFFYGPLAVGVMITATLYFAGIRRFSLARTMFVALTTGLTCVLGFIAGVSVLAYNFSAMVSYAVSLLVHAGAYGAGDATVISLGTMQQDFNNLLANLPLMFIILVAGHLILGIRVYRNRKRTNGQRGLWAFVVGLACQMLLALFLVTKMYNLYYALCVTAAVTVWIALFTHLADSSVILRRLSGVLCVVLLIGYGLTYRNSLVDYDQMANVANTAQAASVAMLNHYAVAFHKDVTQVRQTLGYSTFNDCYYLRFGNEWAGVTLTGLIDDLCPNEFLFSDGDPWEVFLRRYPPAFLFRDHELLAALFDVQGGMELVLNPELTIR